LDFLANLYLVYVFWASSANISAVSYDYDINISPIDNLHYLFPFLSLQKFAASFLKLLASSVSGVGLVLNPWASVKSTLAAFHVYSFTWSGWSIISKFKLDVLHKA